MKKWFGLMVVFFTLQPCLAQTKIARATHFNIERSGLAIQGYDPVSYFTKMKAEKGNSSFQSTVEGVVYYFVSESNKQLFDSNPKQYEPQYGGWCAYAMGLDGSKVAIDPNTFKIVNNKLYLFYNRKGNNTLIDWNKNEAVLMVNGNVYWAKKIVL